MNISRDDILEYHLGGKIGLRLAKTLGGIDDLCKAYTPGVAVPVRAINEDPKLADKYTARANLVAVVTDGTAVLGLGEMGPTASIPVMEGKAVLFKAFGDVDGWPVPLNHCRVNGSNEGPTDPQRVIDHVLALAPMYGGINLEDIAAPACFEIETELDRMLDIPVFHDDQWGTAVITLAGLLNYCILTERDMSELRIVINGAGAAGIRIAEMLKASGCNDVILCDSKGVIHSGRTNLTEKKIEHAAETSARTLGDALKNAHVFIGVSVADCVTVDEIMAMTDYPAIFAMANPDPEIRPEAVSEAMGEKKYVMATGRSDYPNQINNVLGFPFLFRGALDSGASKINIEMKVAAAQALAEVARQAPPDHAWDLFHSKEDFEFGRNCVVPKPFDGRLFTEVSYAVAEAAVESGAAPDMNLEAYFTRLCERNTARLGI
jgi:malate dehydrogenase (oxaloacetate-decarboxylating)(NADP+)